MSFTEMEKQKVQEQLQENAVLHAQITERFEHLADKLEANDRWRERIEADVGAIKNKIFNGFGDAISNIEARIKEIAESLRMLNDKLEKHFRRPHLSVEEVQSIVDNKMNGNRLKINDKSEARRQWLKHHRVEIVLVLMAALTIGDRLIGWIG